LAPVPAVEELDKLEQQIALGGQLVPGKQRVDGRVAAADLSVGSLNDAFGDLPG
jgi:hypothetical protein